MYSSTYVFHERRHVFPECERTVQFAELRHALFLDTHMTSSLTYAQVRCIRSSEDVTHLVLEREAGSRPQNRFLLIPFVLHPPHAPVSFRLRALR
jgi:hypothetical protein